jgi:hypothetical protein
MSIIPRRSMVNYRQSYLRTAEALVLHVWGDLRANGPLSADEHRLASLLLAHPEWQRYWDGRARVPASAEADPDRNPFLHVHLHDLVERQAAERKPAVVAEILAAASRSDRRGDRVHRVVAVLWLCLTDALRKGGALDLKDYEDRLRGLGRTATATMRAVPGRSRAG